MELPIVPEEDDVERLGVSAVVKRLAELGQVWRETDRRDVGIDGQIEFVNDRRQATGRIIAVQIKSGASYFDKRDRGTHWAFYPEEKHRNYWESFPIPVLVILHDESSGLSYWGDARQSLRTPARDGDASINIPKANVLQSTSSSQLFESYGVSQDPILNGKDLVMFMLSQELQNPAFPLNYLELFAHGMTNICRSIFFGMDLATNLVEAKLHLNQFEFGMSVGDDEHNFLFSFVRFLISQNLAEVDYSDCLIDWVDREMQPKFLAPLTRRGRQLVRTIDAIQDELSEKGLLEVPEFHKVAQEDFVQMVFSQSHFTRVILSNSFCEQLKKAADETDR